MSRLQAIEPNNSTGQTKELLNAVKDKFGMVPNMTRVMANSSAVLEGYLEWSGALSKGSLDEQTREQIALLIAQSNRCDYCLSAHTAIGKLVGLSEQQIMGSRRGHGSTPRAAAALTFAARVLDSKGQVGDDDVQKVREAGFNDSEIAEIIAHVALNVFTNYFNTAAQVDIDFPRAPLIKAA